MAAQTGPLPAPLLPALEGRLRDEESYIRSEARAAIGKIRSPR